jgi:hypothetical protein
MSSYTHQKIRENFIIRDAEKKRELKRLMGLVLFALSNTVVYTKETRSSLALTVTDLAKPALLPPPSPRQLIHTEPDTN